MLPALTASSPKAAGVAAWLVTDPCDKAAKNRKPAGLGALVPVPDGAAAASENRAGVVASNLEVAGSWKRSRRPIG
jgi:hypothetical protein